MIGNNWLVCGTRKKGYKEAVFTELNKRKDESLPGSIIEGCCPDSADEYAEEWAKENKVPVQHHPATSGNYLRRNMEMVDKCDMVVAFWDGWSYGTAHTVAQAVLKNKPVFVTSI